MTHTSNRKCFMSSSIWLMTNKSQNVNEETEEMDPRSDRWQDVRFLRTILYFNVTVRTQMGL